MSSKEIDFITYEECPKCKEKTIAVEHWSYKNWLGGHETHRQPCPKCNQKDHE